MKFFLMGFSALASGVELLVSGRVRRNPASHDPVLHVADVGPDIYISASNHQPTHWLNINKSVYHSSYGKMYI